MQRIYPIPEINLIPLQEIQEPRSVTVVATFPAWDLVKGKVKLDVQTLLHIEEATLDNWDKLMNSVQGEVIYAVGGGLAVDAAKYLACQSNRPLVCIPTALSVDAIMAWSSAIREEGRVKYIETTVPEKLLVDFDLIASAPPSIRAAALCDILSIATGSWDWQYAERKGENPPSMRYVSYAAKIAEAILEAALDCAEAAGRGEYSGLRQLLDCIALETQLLNQLGHARPEEGSEHYFAYAVENKVGHGKPHASLVCPAILVIAALQGQDIQPLKKAMNSAHLPLDTLDPKIIRETLLELPDYVRRHGYPYGIAHEINEKMVAKLDLSAILGI